MALSDDISVLKWENAQVLDDISSYPHLRRNRSSKRTSLMNVQENEILRRRFLEIIIGLSRRCHLFPSSLFIKGIQLQSRDPLLGTGLADIFQGLHRGERVAIKRLRVSGRVADERRQEVVEVQFAQFGFLHKDLTYVTSETLPRGAFDASTAPRTHSASFRRRQRHHATSEPNNAVDAQWRPPPIPYSSGPTSGYRSAGMSPCEIERPWSMIIPSLANRGCSGSRLSALVAGNPSQCASGALYHFIFTHTSADEPLRITS